MFKQIVTAAALTSFAGTAAFAQTCVQVPKEKVLEVAQNGSSGYAILTVRRSAIPSLEGQSGWVGVQVFGLNDGQARVFANTNTIEKIEYCNKEALSYKVKATPPDVNPSDAEFKKWHEVDIPVPNTLKGVKVRWCGKSGCISTTYDGDATKILVLDKPETAAGEVVRPKRS